MITNEGEKTFAEHLDAQGLEYIYQPKCSSLTTLHYTPDFYVFQNAMYYEVVGTRQAFHQNKEKIYEASQVIPLSIVHPDGSAYVKSPSPSIEKYKQFAKSTKPIVFVPFSWELFMNDCKISIQDVVSMIESSIGGVKYMVKQNQIKRLYLEKILMRYPNAIDFVGKTPLV